MRYEDRIPFRSRVIRTKAAEVHLHIHNQPKSENRELQESEFKLLDARNKVKACEALISDMRNEISNLRQEVLAKRTKYARLPEREDPLTLKRDDGIYVDFTFGELWDGKVELPKCGFDLIDNRRAQLVCRFKQRPHL